MNESQKKILDVKSQVINIALAFTVLISTPTAIIQFTRIKDTGFNPQMVYVSIVVVTVIFAYIFRKKLSFNFRSILFISLFVLLGISSLLSYGLTSAALLFFIFSTSICTLLYGFKKALFVIVVSILSIFIFGLLYSQGHIDYNFNVITYVKSPYTWGTYTIGLCFFLFTLSLSINHTYKHLEQTIKSLSNNNEELKILNKQLLSEISERKIAEQLAKDNFENYTKLFEGANDAIFILKDNFFFDCNLETLSMFGYSKDEIIGNTPFNISPKYQPDGSLSKEKAIKLLETSRKKRVENFEWMHLNKKGDQFYCEVSLNTLTLKNENFTQAIVRNINDRKVAEQSLKESEARFQAFMKHAPIFAYIKDENLNHIFNNEKITNLIDELKKDTLKTHDFFDDKITALLEKSDKKILSSESTFEDLEYKAKIKDEDFWLRDIKFPIMLPNKSRLIGGVAIDITESKLAEIELKKHKDHLEDMVNERTDEIQQLNEELRQSNEELHTSNDYLIIQKEELQTTLEKLKAMQSHLIQSEKMASIGVLTAGVAHEINNPLNFIHGGYLGLDKYFNKNLKDHLNKVAPLLNAIKEGTKRAADIVSSLNHFSRTGKSKTEKCDIHSIIDNSLIMLQNQLKNKVEIRKEYTDNPLFILGNEGRLHQVFVNILANAGQSIEINGVISIKTKIENKRNIILITDSGCGISEEELKNISDPFFTTKEPGKGTGLGLSIVYKIINEHNGSINFESQLNKGTTVIINFPNNT